MTRNRLSAEVAILESLKTDQLRSRWKALYKTEPPPRISQDLLKRAVAYVHVAKNHVPAKSRAGLIEMLKGIEADVGSHGSLSAMSAAYAWPRCRGWVR